MRLSYARDSKWVFFSKFHYAKCELCNWAEASRLSPWVKFFAVAHAIRRHWDLAFVWRALNLADTRDDLRLRPL